MCRFAKRRFLCAAIQPLRARAFDRDEAGESLRIAFTTHEVRISGRHLRELGIALQKLAVEWVREVPPRYAALAEKGRAFIERIEVAEIEDDEDAPPD